MTEILLVAHVGTGHHLPKTDLLTEIDPYVRLVCQNQHTKTSSRSNNANPIWEKTLVLPIEVDLENPRGRFKIELWDKDLRNDDYVGWLDFELSELIEKGRMNGRFPIQLAEGIKGKDASLSLNISFQFGYQELKQRASKLNPEIVADDRERAFWLSAPALGEEAHLELELEKKAIELKLLLTGDSYWLDFVSTTEQYFKLARKHFDPPKLRGNLSIKEEIEIEDLSLSADFSALQVLKAKRKEVLSWSVAELLERAGVNGGAVPSFQTLKNTLSGKDGIIFHPRKDRVFLPFGEQAHLGLCFGDKRLSVKLYVHEDAPLDFAVDLDILGGKASKSDKKFGVPKRYGHASFSRRVALGGLKLDLINLGDVLLKRYELSEVEKTPINKLFPLR